MVVEAVEAPFPELPVSLEPVRGVLERSGLEPCTAATVPRDRV